MFLSGLSVFAQLYLFQPMLSDLCRSFQVDLPTSSLAVSTSTIGMAAGLSVYAVCEIILNIRTNNVLEIGLLFAGTVALGLCLGFLIGTVLLKGKYL